MNNQAAPIQRLPSRDGSASNSKDAAAMDALNLDDLFLGGDDGIAGGSLAADSLFADMDVDLGDIMDGVIGGGDEGGSLGGSRSGGSSVGRTGLGRVLSMELGRGAGSSQASSLASSHFGSMSSGGKVGKSRTAKTNPHLALLLEQQAKAQQLLQQQQASSGTQQKRQSSVANEVGRLDYTEILTAKRKRRRSKKAIESSVDEGEDGGGGGDAKESRRGSSAGYSREKPPSPFSKIIMAQQQHQQLQQQQHFNHLQGSASSSQQLQQLHQDQPTRRQVEHLKIQTGRKVLYEKAQEHIQKIGLPPSRTLFFPYMALPAEVDVKKKGRKAYPLMDKLNNLSTNFDSAKQGGETGEQPTSSQQQQQQQLSNDASKLIPTSSPMYQIFDQHIGALTDNHGVTHPPSDLQRSLANSLRHLVSCMKSKKRSSKDSQTTESASLIMEIGKLYLGCMKQSLFLRQNLWNMERWCVDRWDEKDVGDALGGVDGGGVVGREEVERVLRMVEVDTVSRARERIMERTGGGVCGRVCGGVGGADQQQHQRVGGKQKKKLVNVDRFALPSPSAPGFTHGGPNATPVINVKIKIKPIDGWRDKSGRKLTAKLWCPTGWMVAMKRAEDNLLKQITQQSQQRGEGVMGGEQPSQLIHHHHHHHHQKKRRKLDLATVNDSILEAVSSELVRPDLSPMKKKAKASGTTESGRISGLASASGVTSTTMTSIPAKFNTSMSERRPSGDAGGDDKKKKKSSSSRKRKSKGSTAATPGGSSASRDASPPPLSPTSSKLSSVGSSKRQRLIPHIPKPRRSAAAMLAPSSSASSSASKSTSNKNGIHAQRKQQSEHLVQFLHKQILHPSLTPTERRQLLGKEIPTTISTLEHLRSAFATPKTNRLQERIDELQSIYLEDKDIFPDCGNTIGFWNWMKKSNYLDGLERERDVYDALEGCWVEDEEGVGGGEDGCYWGSLLPRVSVSEPRQVSVSEAAEVGDGEEVGEDGGVVVSDEQEQQQKEQPSPLFDRLQSLLVEVDDGSDDEDDDDLISNLPPFSPEEFVNGPRTDATSTARQDDDKHNDSTLDVSALTLDQRTFIQLRAAGLVCANTTPFFPQQPRTHDDASPSSSPSIDEESMDVVLSKMKSRLSTINAQNNTETASIQRKALLHVSRAAQRKRQVADVESVLARYRQLLKLQKEKKQQKQQDEGVRTSGRVKTGSNKFDEEQFIPW